MSCNGISPRHMSLFHVIIWTNMKYMHLSILTHHLLFDLPTISIITDLHLPSWSHDFNGVAQRFDMKNKSARPRTPGISGNEPLSRPRQRITHCLLERLALRHSCTAHFPKRAIALLCQVFQMRLHGDDALADANCMMLLWFAIFRLVAVSRIIRCFVILTDFRQSPRHLISRDSMGLQSQVAVWKWF